jgi:hypothetical protein
MMTPLDVALLHRPAPLQLITVEKYLTPWLQSLQTNIYREHTDEHNIHCICILIGAINEILYLFLCYNTIYCLFREVHINNSCICFICWQCTYIVSIWNTSYCSFRIISLFGNISVKTWNSFFHHYI